MTIIADLKDRLETMTGGPKKVAGATAIAALKTAPPRAHRPKGYVMIERDTARGESRPGATRSEAAREVSLFTAHDLTADPESLEAAESIEVYRKEIIDRLQGFKPADHSDLVYAGFVISKLDAGQAIIWTQIRFTTNQQLRSLS